MLTLQLKKQFGNLSLIPTSNKTGYTVKIPDECIQAFIDFSLKHNGSVLDIGCAYGVAVIPLLKSKIKITALDLSQKHLNFIKEISKNSCYLNTIKAKFPLETNFSNKSFDAILISRILHFLSPQEIKTSMQKLYTWLKPEGKVFASVATPYSQIYKDYIPKYEKNKINNKPWPGIIKTNQESNHLRVKDMPQYLNLFDKELLENLFKKENFIIEESGYLTNKNLPNDIKLDNRETAYLIAAKN